MVRSYQSEAFRGTYDTLPSLSKTRNHITKKLLPAISRLPTLRNRSSGPSRSPLDRDDLRPLTFLFCRHRLRNGRAVFARIGRAKIHARRKIPPHSLPAAHIRRKASVHLNLMPAFAQRLSHIGIDPVLHLHIASSERMLREPS